MSVKQHYRVFISNVRGREGKKTEVPTVTASLCPIGQDLSCAHSTKPAEGTTHTEWKMSKVIRVCVCVLGLGLGSKRGEGRLHWQKATDQEPPGFSWRCHGDADARITLWNQQWRACEDNYNLLPLEFNLSLKSINPIMVCCKNRLNVF